MSRSAAVRRSLGWANGGRFGKIRPKKSGDDEAAEPVSASAPVRSSVLIPMLPTELSAAAPAAPIPMRPRNWRLVIPLPTSPFLREAFMTPPSAWSWLQLGSDLTHESRYARARRPRPAFKRRADPHLSTPDRPLLICPDRVGCGCY